MPVARSEPGTDSALPDPPRSAFAALRPVPLARSRTESTWAAVERAVDAQWAPAGTAPSVGRLSTRTPEGTSNIVSIIGRRADRSGNLWIRVRLPSGPKDTTGWVPRSALGGYHSVPTELVVRLGRLTATLLRDGRPLFQAPVAVGRPGWSTPTGRFYIRNRLSDFESPAYGPVAFGTSARSSVGSDWPAGGFIGIHGTDLPQLVPGRVSHGCIRLRNEDIRALERLMPVGTPLTIRR
jgi:L,D-transpeptidase catalytic domain